MDLVCKQNMEENVPVSPDNNTVPSDSKESKEPPEENRVTGWVVIAVITTILGSGFPAGYCLGVINTPQEIIRSWLMTTVEENYGYVLTRSEEIYVWASVVSVYIVGAIIGSPLGAVLADKVGRRLGLFINHLLFLLAACLFIWCTKAESIYMLIFGRFISGICSGLSTSLMPVYLSEVVPASLRGVMGVLLPAAMSVGVLVSLTLGIESILGTKSSWPYLLGGFGIPVLMALVMHPALPDSPSYCFLILEDETRGRKALYQLRGGPSKSVDSEEASLRSQMIKNQYKGNTWGLFSMIKDEKYKLPLLIAMIFNLGQQFAGINAVFYYSTLIFQSAGLNIDQSQGASIGAAGINAIVSIIAIPLIRYTRRRILMLCSIALCIGCQAVLLTSLELIPIVSFASYIAIAALMAFVFSYHVGVGPVPFMIATELFPSGPRSVGISVGSTSNWLSNLVVGLTFPLIQDQIGPYSFILFIISSCFLWAFTYKLLPETLGQEEVPPLESPKSLRGISSDTPNEV